MNVQEVVSTSSSSELAHSLDKRSALNIAYRASQLDYTSVGLFVRIINRYLRNILNPVLNGIGQMRHNLDCLAQVVAFPLFLYDMLVHLACCDVVVSRQGNVEVSLVVSEIEVDFTTIVEDEALPVPSRRSELRPEGLEEESSTPAATWSQHQCSCMGQS